VLSNSEIASHLYELARLSALADGSNNAFRVRAYEDAARSIDGATEPVAEMSESALTGLKGVGKSTASKIRELVEGGSIAKLEELRKEFPPDFVELTRVPGVGPKTAVQLRDALGVSSVEDLKAAIAAESIRELPGFGARTEENLARSIERLGIGGKERRPPIIEAMRTALEVCQALMTVDGVQRAEPMGSLRRFRETIGDVDVLVVSTGDHQAVADRFVELPVVNEVVDYGARKSAVLSASGMRIDLRVVEPDQWGSAAIYFTGSKAHNIHLRQMALDRGWTLSEYALAEIDTEKVIASKTEEEVYAALGLAWVPPELREDSGDIEAARDGTLPALAEVKHLRGDLHVHTSLSGDGRDRLEDMVQAAADRKYLYLGITDHAEDLAINGASRRQMLAQRTKIEALQGQYPEMRLLHGAELNIGRDGSVDYDADFLSGFGWGVASVHSLFDLDRAKQTERIVTAMRDPAVNAIGHLTGRRIGKRPGIELDVDAVLDAAEETGCAIEINCHLDRLDAPAEVLLRARDRDVLFVIGTDAHDVGELRNAVWGIHQSHRGWVERSKIVNTWTQAKFLKWVGEKRMANSEWQVARLREANP